MEITQDRVAASIAKTLGHERRSIELRDIKSEADGSKRRIRFTAASDRPLVRDYGFVTIRESTDFAGLDTERLRGGDMPLLNSHQSRGLENIIGKIVDFGLESRAGIDGGKERVLSVTAEFDVDDPDSAKAWRKVESGLARNVSIGWAITEPDGVSYRELDEKDADGGSVWEVKYTAWEITEISLVSTPADNRIGFGRSLADAMDEKIKNHLKIITAERQAQEPETPTMSEQETPKEAPQAVEQAVEQRAIVPAAPEADAAVEHDGSGMRYLAKQHARILKKGVSEEAYQELVDEAGSDEGLSEDAVRARLFDLMEQRDAKAIGNAGKGEAPAVHIPGAKHNSFNFGRAARLLAERGTGINGREADVIAEFEDSWPAHLRPEKAGDSIFIPFSAFAENESTREQLVRQLSPEKQAFYREQSRAYSVGGTPTGPFQAVFDENWWSESLFASAATLPYVTRLTPQQTQNKLGFTQTGVVGTSFVSSEAAARTESTAPTYGSKSLTWKMIVADIDVSLRTLDQSGVFEDLTLDAMRTHLMRGVNNSILTGTGSGGQPTGLQHLGISEVTLGADANTGGNPDYATMVDLRTLVKAANADYGRRGRYLITPEIESRLYKTPRFTGSTGAASDVVLSVGPDMMVNQDGYPVTIENNLPKTLQKNDSVNVGTSPANNHVIIYGLLDQIELGSFSAVELLVDPFTSGRNSQVRYLLRYAFDFNVRHTASFARCVTATA